MYKHFIKGVLLESCTTEIVPRCLTSLKIKWKHVGETYIQIRCLSQSYIYTVDRQQKHLWAFLSFRWTYKHVNVLWLICENMIYTESTFHCAIAVTLNWLYAVMYTFTLLMKVVNQGFFLHFGKHHKKKE